MRVLQGVALLILLAATACAMEQSSEGTLPPLLGSVDEPSAPSSTAPHPSAQEQWYASYVNDVSEHRGAIRALRGQLARAADDETRKILCTAALDIDTPAYDRAHDAR